MKKYTKEDLIEVLCERRNVDEKTGCHNYTGLLNPNGYGKIKYLGKAWIVHRLWWTLHRGEVPKGLFVLHNCDNPACFNLEHLRIGTHAQNMHDKVLRPKPYQKPGRAIAPRAWSQLNEEKAKIIIAKLKQGISQAKVAQEFEVSRQTVNDVACGKTWKYLTNQEDLKVIKTFSIANQAITKIGNKNTKGKVINRGSNHGNSIFTEEQVCEIKRSLKQDSSADNVLRLACKYNASKGTIRHIRRGTRWGHIQV